MPGAALVEELDHGGVGADGDDQRGAGLVGQQHGGVLAGALDARTPRSRRRRLASSSRPGARPSGCTWWTRSAPHRSARSDTESKSPMIMSGLRRWLEQGVGAAVDADEHRSVLADVGPQGPEVLLVVVAPHHDQRVAALEVGLQGRQDQRREGELGLAADVLEGVHREALELLADRASGAPCDRRRRPPRCAPRPVATHLAVDADVAVVDRDRLAVRRARRAASEPTSSMQRDAGGQDPDRAPVRVAAGDRRRGVDDGRHPGVRRGRRRPPGRGRRGR